MPSYSYIAVDAMGKEKKATIDAENQDKAAARLKKNGLTLISIKEVGMLEKDIKLSFGNRRKIRDFPLHFMKCVPKWRKDRHYPKPWDIRERFSRKC